MKFNKGHNLRQLFTPKPAHFGIQRMFSMTGRLKGLEPIRCFFRYFLLHHPFAVTEKNALVSCLPG